MFVIKLEEMLLMMWHKQALGVPGHRLQVHTWFKKYYPTNTSKWQPKNEDIYNVLTEVGEGQTQLMKDLGQKASSR